MFRNIFIISVIVAGFFSIPAFAQEQRLVEPAPEIAFTADPYRITYTITEYYPNRGGDIPVTVQEKVIQRAFDHWLIDADGNKIINAEAIYIKDADPKSVVCEVKFHNTGRAYGNAGGDGPNTWCFVGICSNCNLSLEDDLNNITDVNMYFIASHEIGHGLGLQHNGLATCQMSPNVGWGLTHCALELQVLQRMWDNPVCTIPQCMKPVETIPTEQSLATTQLFSWMIPVILSGTGIGLFVFRKTENSKI